MKINGSAAPDDTLVRTFSTSGEGGSCYTTGDTYFIKSTGGQDDDTVWFTVDGCQANETSTWEDGESDEVNLTVTFPIWYQDSDGDGYGNPSVSKAACSQPAGYVSDNTDCDDSDPDEHPGQTWWHDGDGDGYGDGTSETQCGDPGADYYIASDLTQTSGDCDDSNASIIAATDGTCDWDSDGHIDNTAGGDDCDDNDPNNYPGNTEICDGQDNDCDGDIDCADSDMADSDGDSDGYCECDDCDDSDPDVYPGATEVCNGKDDDCDGQTDEEGAEGCTTFYKDADDDTYGLSGNTKCLCSASGDYTASRGGDCNDNDSTVHPGASELCDGKDNDCDGNTPANEADDDDDGYRICAGDCDDSDDEINPGADEICDGIDNDCDGDVDCADSECTAPNADAAGDYSGYRSETITLDGSGSNDPDGDAILNYEWRIDGSTVYDGPNSTYDLDLSGYGLGSYSVTLSIVDESNCTDLDEATLTVSNAPPIADADGPYSGYLADSVSLDGSGSFDPDGDIVNYEWLVDGAQVYSGPDSAYDLALGGYSLGEHAVELTVTDDDADTDADSTTITVHGTAAGLSLAPATASITAGQRVTYTVWATDTSGNGWDATADAAYAIDSGAGGSWDENVYTAQYAGTWTVTSTVDGQEATASLTVVRGPAVSIKLEPDAHGVEAGEAVTYTVTAGNGYGNTWDVTAEADLSIDGGAGGSWADNVYTSEFTGTWNVTATVDSLSDTTTLAVHGAAVSVTLAPATATVSAGEDISYTLWAADAAGNIWNASADADYAIDASAEGSWTANAYSAQIAGNWSVTATLGGGLSDNAVLTVGHGPAVTVTLAPASASITAGQSITYTLWATDTYGNGWDATDEADYSIESGAGGRWKANIYTAQYVGDWIVTATWNGSRSGPLDNPSDTAKLEVVRAPVDRVEISPSTAIITAYQSISYTVTAFDASGNEWDATPEAKFFIKSGAQGEWVDNVYQSEVSGVWEVVAVHNGRYDTATLTVIGPAPTITGLNPESITAGGTGFYLTVEGFDFSNTSIVHWDGAALATTFISSTRLMAYVTTADFAAAGVVDVTVVTPAPGGGVSNAMSVTVNPANERPVANDDFVATDENTPVSIDVTANDFDPDGFLDISTLFISDEADGTALGSTHGVVTYTPATNYHGSDSFKYTIDDKDGATSNEATVYVTVNAAPVIYSLNPTCTPLGTEIFELTIDGANFISTSVAYWDGAARTTTYVNTTCLTAEIDAADVAQAANVDITVVNPSPGGGKSNMMTFSVENPAPTITELDPDSATAGAAAFSLTVNGTGFVPSSTVRWDGSGSFPSSPVHWDGAASTTTYVSPTRLTAEIAASEIAQAGEVDVTVINSSPGGGTSNVMTFSVQNPAPTITELDPVSATAGAAAFSLAVDGSGFVLSSTVQWDGAARTTTYVSPTRLTADITAADVADAGECDVTVVNPSPGGGTSNVMTFSVENPAPTITELDPDSATAGAAAFSLTVDGTGFVDSSTVQWDGAARTTTYVNATRLTADITAADVADAGEFDVTVANPSPGGGTSNAATFTVAQHSDAVAMTIAPLSETIKAGQSVTYTAWATDAQGNGWDATAEAGYAIDAGAGGSWDDENKNIYTGQFAGLWTVTASLDEAEATAQLTVEHDRAATLTLSPASEIITAGQSVTYTAWATDTSGNGWDATAEAAYAIDAGAGGSWDENVYTSERAGSWSVSASLDDASDEASLTVDPDAAAELDFDPIPDQMVGEPFTITITAYDAYANVAAFSGPVALTDTTETITPSLSGEFTSGIWSGLATIGVGASDVVITATADALAGVSDPFTVSLSAPTLNSLDPISAVVGGPSFDLTVTGAGFVDGATVRWDGVAKSTTFVSSTRLVADIPAEDIAVAGMFDITVVNPAPSGGASNPLPFEVVQPAQEDYFAYLPFVLK